MAFTLPPYPSLLRALNISTNEYHLAVLTLIVPFAVIWFSAFYSYAQLRRYAKSISTVREGSAFKKIAYGIGVLAWGLAIPTILSIILAAITVHFPGFLTSQDIISNYVALLVPVIGFTLIGGGAGMLTRIIKNRPSQTATRIMVLIFVIIGVLFAHFAIQNSLQKGNSYHLTLWLLILTIVVPYLYAWFVGLLGTYELWIYSQKIQGIIYKRALVQFASGITITILGSVCLQYLAGAFFATSKDSFTAVLIVFYLLLVVQAVGYSLIALGARHLQKIEEV
ncbi:MAG: hypothetical protein ACREF5_02800 [Candidatus Saccharimonadales bacterium]